jgi:hypothetical protein
MILVTRPNDLKLHKLTICLAVWHVVGNQKPLKGPSEQAQITPLHKKNDLLSKTNYKSVSVLSVFSKIFEKVFEKQLSDFFDTIFNPYRELSLMNKNISFMKTLNKRCPSIDHCRTPLWMSGQLLRTLLTFICCFLFDKNDFSNETE